jgi:hypothetical protein
VETNGGEFLMISCFAYFFLLLWRPNGNTHFTESETSLNSQSWYLRWVVIHLECCKLILLRVAATIDAASASIFLYSLKTLLRKSMNSNFQTSGEKKTLIAT